MNLFYKIGEFFNRVGESFYNSIIYDNRYEYILEGLFHTILIAFFAVIMGIIRKVVWEINY